jgi:hypothetical protein
MLLLLQAVILVAMQALLVLFYKRHMNMEIAISSNEASISHRFAPALLDQTGNTIESAGCLRQPNASILPLSG